jgi:hypothetical protein
VPPSSPDSSPASSKHRSAASPASALADLWGRIDPGSHASVTGFRVFVYLFFRKCYELVKSISGVLEIQIEWFKLGCAPSDV